MPKIENMRQTMRDQGITEATIAQLPMPRIKKATPEEIVTFIVRMDEILSHEQCISVMDEQGCNKSNKCSAAFRKFGETHKDKSLKERIALLTELDSGHKVDVCCLNEDGTITLKFGLDGKKGEWNCPCTPIKKLKPYNFPILYCGCCGAHVRYTHEFALGVKLRLKEIVSSKANSDGEKPCEFTYEIVDE
jgi:hypothetical protein